MVGYRSDVAKLDADRLTDHDAPAAKRGGDPTGGASDDGYDVWTKYDAVPDDERSSTPRPTSA